MKENESKLPEDWFTIADRDLRRVEIMLSAADLADAGVHLQQAIEKYLKGYLLSRGWELERIHNLVKLIDYAVDFDPSFEDFRELCQRATAYYAVDRYPFFISAEPTEKEVRDGLIKAEELKNKILKDYKGE